MAEIILKQTIHSNLILKLGVEKINNSLILSSIQGKTNEQLMTYYHHYGGRVIITSGVGEKQYIEIPSNKMEFKPASYSNSWLEDNKTYTIPAVFTITFDSTNTQNPLTQNIADLTFQCNCNTKIPLYITYEDLSNQTNTYYSQVQVIDAIPIKDGYTFLGWNDTTNGGMYYPSQDITGFISNDAIFKAVWYKPPSTGIIYINNNGQWGHGVLWYKNEDKWKQEYNYYCNNGSTWHLLK